MNAAIVSGLTILAASLSLITPLTSLADGCEPHSVQNQTKFPLRSQMRGQEGTVYLNVVVDETGRARSAELDRSSGFRLLDRAATRSVLEHWVFDVSNCQRKDLPINHYIAVEYRNPEG